MALLLALLAAFLTRGGTRPTIGLTASPTPGAAALATAAAIAAATAAAAPTATPPPGWTQILPALRLTDNAGGTGLVASVARPGRAAGCALPATSPAGAPVFVLSDDGGRTWQTYPISPLHSEHSCAIVADTRRPDTFVAGPAAFGSDNDGMAAVTADAGRTWRALFPPANTQIALGGSPGFAAAFLVDGQLIAVPAPLGSDPPRLVETSLDDPSGAWRRLDATIPFAADDTARGIVSLAVDPANAARIYVAVVASLLDNTKGIIVYATADSGRSWARVHQWPGSERLALWTATDGALYVEDQGIPGASPVRLYRGANHGANWMEIQPPDQHWTAFIFFGPSGRIVSSVETSLYALDPKTGASSALGPLPDLWAGVGAGAYLGVVAEGPSPAFIAASQLGTYLLPLR